MGQNKVKTTAEKVMLFIDGAQVTRTKQVDIPAGNSTLIFTGLSPYMDAQSMQVSAKGKLTVTAVNRQYNYIDSLAVSEKQIVLESESSSQQGYQSEGADYVLNTNTMKFHYPSCRHVKTIKSSNRWDYHGDREEVINMGYIPCKTCKP